MSDKKNIDRLFQERFKDFEATPSDAVWNNIEIKLQQKDKKRRVIPIWWRYAGVAALLLLLLTVGNNFLGEPSNVIPSNSSNNVVDTENATRSSASENETTISVATDINEKDAENASKNSVIPIKTSTLVKTESYIDKSENALNSASKKKSNTNIQTEKRDAIANHSEEKNNELIQDKSSIIKTTKSKVVLNNNITEPNSIAENSEKENNILLKKESTLEKDQRDEIDDIEKKNNTTIANTQTKEDNQIGENKASKTPSIEDLLNESKDIIEDEKGLNKWSVTPNAAPVYFNTLSEGSSIGGQFNNNAKTAEANMSYGISASYAVNKKLSIRSGINKVNLGYNINNAVVYETLAKSSSSSLLISNVKTTSQNTNSAENVTVVSGESFESNEIKSLVSDSSTSINQSFAYIEVPLEIQYNLSDKKLGINLIGGFSSFFLNDNELFSEVEGNRTSIGEATNINNISYSANLGIGFQYKFTKKLNLNLEPMFKYQINTFNNTSGNFTPYFIGVYTGIGFKF